MRLLGQFPVAILVISFCSWTGCGHKEEHEKEGEKAKGQEKETVHIERTKEGEIVLTVPEAAQKRIGLRVEPLAESTLSPETKAYGRVLDAAILAALVSDVTGAELTAQVSQKEVQRVQSVQVAEQAAAQSAANVSRAEYKRLKKLHEQNNVSTRALEAAEAATKRDQLQLESQRTASERALQTAQANAQRDQFLAATARNKLTQATGKALADRNDLPALLQKLANGETALVRVDVLAGEQLAGTPSTARFNPLSTSGPAVEADLIGAAAGVDPQVQGQGFLFLTKGAASGLPANSIVTAWLRQPGDARKGVVVPPDAIVRFNGLAWVYVRVKEDEFVRREIALTHPAGPGWFVAAGVKPQDSVATVGAQQMLSEELKALSGPEE